MAGIGSTECGGRARGATDVLHISSNATAAGDRAASTPISLARIADIRRQGADRQRWPGHDVLALLAARLCARRYAMPGKLPRYRRAR